MVERLFLDLSLKNQSLACLWINSLKFYTFCFYCLPNWDYLKILKVNRRPLAFTSLKAFLKNKEAWNLSLCLIFCMTVEEKYFLLHSVDWSNFIICLSLLREQLSNMSIVIVYQPGCNFINFEINLLFLIKPFFLYGQKFKAKI